MATNATESLARLNTSSGDTEPLINPNAPSIVDSLTACLTRWRAEFTELRSKVASLPTDHPDRRTHARHARSVNARISETVAILDLRHWKDEEGKKKRGRPAKQKEVEG